MRTHYLALLVIAVVACQSPKKEPGIHKITFGSCSRQDMEKQMWSEIIPDSADLWIWAGDNIYGDTEDMELMKSKYDKQKNRDSYRQFTGSVKHLIGIWDDHDYGLNDGGKEYPKRDESKKLMLDFLDADPDDPRWKRNGAYGSYEFGPEGQKVKVILLDTRYFRDPLKKDTVNGRRINVPAPGTILGEEQWLWLEKELANTTASINFIVSSIQVIAEDHIYEKWANFPQERERLFDLLGQLDPPGVIILSGDRHIAEFSQVTLPGLSYPLVDFTSSGLTHTWSFHEEELNSHRVGKQIMELNYGLIELDWNNDSVSVEMSVRGQDGAIYERLNRDF